MVIKTAPWIIIFIFLTLGLKSLCHENPAGFISIDCGSTGPSTDPKTNLLWVDDENYTMMGKNGRIPKSTEWINFNTTPNYPAVLTFRYFPQDDMRSKYCYELPSTASNISFLLRAMFLHGNATELSLPIRFQVYVNGTKWKDIYIEKGDEFTTYSQESIFFLPPGGNITNVCLVPSRGVPFISSLELRHLDSERLVYATSFVGRLSQELYFTNLIRYNFGGADYDGSNYISGIIRYPDDPYDRLWYPQNCYLDYGTEVNVTEALVEEVGPELNSIPRSALSSACVLPGSDGSDDYSGDVISFLEGTEPGSMVYGIIYSAILNQTTNGSQISGEMEADGQNIGSFTITTQPSQKSFFHIMNANFTVLQFTSDLFMNALEYYEQDSFIAPTTDDDDVRVVNLLKEVLNKTTWQGDPCIPVPYDWVECGQGFDSNVTQSYGPGVTIEWYVDTLKLSYIESSSEVIEKLNKGETGWEIYVLTLTNSHISTDSFQSLLHHFINVTWLFNLDMSYNDISIFPDAKWWMEVSNGSPRYLQYLDLSYNQLTQLPPFVDLPFSTWLSTLNVSNNRISSEFLKYSSFSNLSNLQILNISSNGMDGSFPISLSPKSLPYLGLLDISNNNFSGTFPGSFFHEALNVSVSYFWDLNADNNQFSDTLDLTGWYQTLKSYSENASAGFDLSVTQLIFSFVNNKISNINPSADDFGPFIQSMMNEGSFNQSGIFLGGNPYCKGAESFPQRYICRTSANETIPLNMNKRKSLKLGIIITSVLGAAFALLCLSLCTVAIWLLQKKVQALKRVEQELATRRVQPPYYSYYDLKLATNYFSKENRLGRGNFAEVFKGILADGTTVAVKRLFISNKKQVLSEFLNEVVLITGIKHKHLIQLKGCCIENEERILVYGYAENGNIEDALWGESPKTKLSWRNRFKICVGIASGLTYLHEELIPRIIHRDIKPANILLDQNLNPKIADFGLAKHFEEEIDRHVTQVISGTRGYFAPEYISEGILSTKVDVFSFGVLALEIVSGRKNFDPTLPPQEIQLRSWAQKLQSSGSALKLLDPTLHSDYSELEVLKVIDIAIMCINTNPELRPTMSEVEIMLLESHERVFDILCTAALKKEDHKSSLDKIYNSFEKGMGDDTISTLFSGRESQGSGASGSLSQGSKKLKDRIDTHPLLASDSLKLDWELDPEATKQPTSTDARGEYDQTLYSMEQSLSERIKFHLPR